MRKILVDYLESNINDITISDIATDGGCLFMVKSGSRYMVEVMCYDDHVTLRYHRSNRPLIKLSYSDPDFLDDFYKSVVVGIYAQ